MRRILIAVVSGLILLSGMLTASPANAAASPSSTHLQCQGSSWSFANQAGPGFTGAAGDQLTISNPSTSGAGTVTWSLPAGYTLVSGSLTLTATGASAVISYGSSDGTLSVTATSSCGGTSASIGVTITGGSGGGGGGGSSSSDSSTPSVETSTPSVETLSLSLAASGATCTGGNPTGYAGTWLTLPSADQCTQSGPTAKSGAKLLGWATSSSFPVARAQAQVDKKWGVIDEVIDGERMIFIPGGMATFVSGSNNLFPIWSA